MPCLDATVRRSTLLEAPPRGLGLLTRDYRFDQGVRAEICSIGGNIATNARGLCCVKYGITSDYVLGRLQVVPADGTAVRLGGPRLKDVGGLSLTKLFVGSEDTLGVLTEVTLRLLPPQNPPSTAVATFGTVESAAHAVVTITGKIRPSMLEFMDAVAINAVEDKLKMGWTGRWRR
jgi:FAD/FMN-containing dehydrogenase